MASKAPKESKSVHEIVTDKILAMLEAGVAPWRQPWNNRGPKNGVSNKPYRGMNTLLLGMMPYTDSRWFTFRQITEMGGTVRKGEKSSLVTFWRFLDAKPKGEDEDQEGKAHAMLRYYLVFNASQCEGLNLPAEEQLASEIAAPEEVQYLVDAYLMAGGPSLRFGGNRACYAPMLDRIDMPKPEQFESDKAYASTLLHEVGHSTGHSSRLARFGAVDCVHGGTSYGQEELVAELFSAMVAGSLGLDLGLEQSAAYLDHWAKAIRADKTLIIKAAGAAQKAMDLFMGRELAKPIAA